MNIPNELIESFQSNDVVLFVGADISVSAGLPSRVDFVRPLAKAVGARWPDDESYLTPDHLLKALQYYENKNGRRFLIQRLRRALRRGEMTPIHHLIASLPVPVIFTTNVDDLIEQALSEVERDFNEIVTQTDLAYWSEKELQVVKLCGDLKRADSLVLTQRDFNRYFMTHQRLAERLRTTLESKTPLFLGYSLDEPFFNQIWDNMGLDFGKHRRRGYAVLLDPDPLDVEELRERGIVVINLERGQQPIPLTAWLKGLSATASKELSAPDDSSRAEESHISDLFAAKSLPEKERDKALRSEISASSSDDSSLIVKPLIMTEGKTDWKHLKAAWQRLKAEGHFDELEIEFLEYEEDIKMGSGDLKNFCTHASKAPQDRPVICIFDCDEANITKAVSVPDQKYKDWGNNIFSFTIPVPDHRQKTPKISIEFYYTDPEIMQPDKQGRRLFLSSEFYASSRHKSEDLTCTDLNKIRRKDVSIIDHQVFNKQHKNVALPKNKFANYILQQKEGFHEFDVSQFIKIFDIIVMIVQGKSPQG